MPAASSPGAPSPVRGFRENVLSRAAVPEEPGRSTLPGAPGGRGWAAPRVLKGNIPLPSLPAVRPALG